MLKCKNIFCIEGNIGAGKSTVLGLIKERIDPSKKIIYVHEPVDDFKISEINGKTHYPLEAYYANPDKEALPFQWWVLKCYEKTLQSLVTQSTSEHTILFDRGVYSSSVFANALLYKDKITPFGHSLFMNELGTLLNKYFGNKIYGVDKMYMIDTPLDKCLRNIKTRNRKEEINTEVDGLLPYLLDLHYHYDDYISLFKAKKCPCSFRRNYFEEAGDTANDVVSFFELN